MLSAGATAAAVPASAEAPSETFAELAYSNGGRIYSLRADGSNRRLLVGRTRPSQTSGDGEPVWSPDGRSLAFSRAETHGEDDRSQIMVRDAAGIRALTALRRGRQDVSPSWSHDGMRIAFARYVSRDDTLTSSILIAERDGSGASPLMTRSIGRHLTTIGGPTWLPDNRTISYTRSTLDRDSNFHSSVYTVHDDGTSRTRLLREAQSAIWSRDGSSIAYISIKDRNGTNCGSDECSYNGELYVARADGSAALRLTRNTGDDEEPEWSPDGERILFSSDRNYPDGESREVYSVAPDGSCLTWLTNGTPSSGSPAWRPESPGRTDPGRCGAARRKPLVEIAPGRGAKRSFWLGSSYRGLLLSDYDPSDGSTFFAYDDCGRFRARSCPPSVQVATGSVCEPGAFEAFLQSSPEVRRRRGALVADYGFEGGIELFTGRNSVSLSLGGGTERQTRRELGADLRGLVRVGSGDRRGGRLPHPRVSAKLARKLRAAVRARTRYGSVRRAAKALGVRRSRLRGRLRLARALRRAGGIRAVHCPRAR